MWGIATVTVLCHPDWIKNPKEIGKTHFWVYLRGVPKDDWHVGQQTKMKGSSLIWVCGTHKWRRKETCASFGSFFLPELICFCCRYHLWTSSSSPFSLIIQTNIHSSPESSQASGLDWPCNLDPSLWAASCLRSWAATRFSHCPACRQLLWAQTHLILAIPLIKFQRERERQRFHPFRES